MLVQLTSDSFKQKPKISNYLTSCEKVQKRQLSSLGFLLKYQNPDKRSLQNRGLEDLH